MQNVKRILRYLQSTKTLGIEYREKDSKKLIAYYDSDYADDTDFHKSTTGFVIQNKRRLISWSSRKQQIVALLNTEAEFIATSELQGTSIP